MKSAIPLFALRCLCLSACLLLVSPRLLVAAEVAFSVDRWPCGTSPKVGAEGASATWAGGTLTVRLLAQETNSTIAAGAGSSVEQREDDLTLSYTEEPTQQARACAVPVVLTFVVSGLERKPRAVSVMVRREQKRIEVEG